LYLSNSNPRLSDTDKTALIRAEQTKLVFHALPVALIASVINALILVFIQRDVIEQRILVTWLAAFLVITAARLFLAYAYKKSSDNVSRAENWTIWFTVGVICSGFAWGSLSVWLFPLDDVGHQVVLAFVLAGTCAGASTSLSFLRLPITVFLLVVLVPLASQFLLLGDKLSVAMGIMTILFFIGVLVNSIRLYRNTEQNIALRIEAHFREQALRESEEKYHLIFDAAPLGVVHYDKDGVITEFNNRFVQILGTGKKNINHLSLIHGVNDPDLKQAIQKTLTGEFSQYEGKSNALGGEQDKDVRIYCRGIKANNGEFIGGVAIVDDITEDKKVERLKSEFVSTVSHELRTPLTAIRGAVGLLNEGVAGELSTEARKLTEISQENTNRLLMLIDDILDISKIELGELSFEFKELEVWNFLEQAVRTMEPYARQHQVKLVLKRNCYPFYISADHDRMMQIMYNLLSNAVKFSPPHGVVEIAMECVAEDIKISVKDSGPGIPEEFQDVIFNRFTQFDGSDSRSTGGTGLGLAITKALVEKQNGHIDFDTSKYGTTFYIVMPNA
jgi:PAS domain S-box-containing protein